MSEKQTHFCTQAFHRFCKLDLRQFLAMTKFSGIQSAYPPVLVRPLVLGQCEFCKTTLAFALTEEQERNITANLADGNLETLARWLRAISEGTRS